MTETVKPKSERRRVLKQGLVVSDRMDKTRTIRIDRLVKHEKYGKYLRKKTVVYAHDEKNTSKAGDLVEIEFCRPLSKQKRWRITRVVKARAAVLGAVAGADVAETIDPKGGAT